ncbi:MAG: hypothetical protein ABFD04_11650 [Syntrophomonas sp.]
MKSEWRVTSNIIDGEKMYAVYRLRDAQKTDHSGNREFAGEYVKDREQAEFVAANLNLAEKEKAR